MTTAAEYGALLVRLAETHYPPQDQGPLLSFLMLGAQVYDADLREDAREAEQHRRQDLERVSTDALLWELERRGKTT